MIGLGIIEVFLSQIPNFHNLSWLSIIAAIMSFGYAFIGIGLSLATIIQGIFYLLLVIYKFFIVVIVIIIFIIIFNSSGTDENFTLSSKVDFKVV
jgi:uncharacterized membrane protein